MEISIPLKYGILTVMQMNVKVRGGGTQVAREKYDAKKMRNAAQNVGPWGSYFVLIMKFLLGRCQAEHTYRRGGRETWRGTRFKVTRLLDCREDLWSV